MGNYNIRDGPMTVKGNGDKFPTNYEPNSYNGPTQNPAYKWSPVAISGAVGRYPHSHPNDNFEQPRALSTRFLRSRIVWTLSRTSPALSASADRISRTGSVPFSLRLTPAMEQTLPRMLVLSCTQPRSEPYYFCYFYCIMGNVMMHTEQFLLCLHAYQITTDSVLYSFLKYQTQ